MRRELFIEKVLAFVHNHHLWEKGDRILAAVSGGPDSLGLLYFLKEVEKREAIHIGCCCVNHHLREAAEKETVYVASLCSQRGIPFYRRDVYVNESRKVQKGSVETVARCLRYDALYEVMEEGHFTKLVTAHHEDDQAETILFHLLRGSGLKGLTGIKPRRGRIIRPFLGVTKKEIHEFLASFHVDACHDETNDIPDVSRNRIRLCLMPALLEFNPNLVHSLCHMAENLSGDEDYLEKAAWSEEKWWTGNKDILLYPLSQFEKVHPAIQRRILLSAVKQMDGSMADFEGIERMRRLALEGRNGVKTSLSGVMMEKSREALYFYKGSTRRGKKENESDDMSFFYHRWAGKNLTKDDKTGIIDKISADIQTLDGWKMTLEKRDTPVIPAKNQYLLDGDAVGCLKLRKAEKSDILEPLGMDGKKSVFSVLREKGIPSSLRLEWPVAADENHVYWVGLLRGSRLARVNEHTKSFVLLTLTWKDKEIEEQS
ncbi:tRNA lysidine(34) synthetase TilS [uncultured Dialister sp.]|uniref:tRNA lysidine(34) synthetase TilS n=1 Tax=uncultured Dialister sp. TaxID=278064 RepID=UPI0025F41C2C|nr:tRNA lysidine(34) synthetase TilS [uncultured Dialister sp.]